MALDIKVTSPSQPGVTGTSGGTITVTNNNDGTWQLTSFDVITYFRFDTNKADITQVEIITEELTSIGVSGYWDRGICSDLTNMTTFIASPSAFGKVIEAQAAWRNCSSLTSFPEIDTSNVTNIYATWQNCSSMSSFPDLNTSNITKCAYAWQDCSSLTSFPLIDTSSVTALPNAWRNCSSLTSFPEIDTSNVKDFKESWKSCSLLTSFPLIDTSSGTTFVEAWSGCTSLTSFPLIDTSKGTNFERAWFGCTSLTSFPLLITSQVTNFRSAWHGCSSLTSFPLIDTSMGTDFLSTWHGCSSLTSFPAIDISQGTSFQNTWYGCSSLTSFPLLDFSNVTSFYATWQNCSSLTSFPLIDISSTTAFTKVWQDCSSLTSFPLIDTSKITRFMSAWHGCSSLTSFPEIDTSEGIYFDSTWRGCSSLTSFHRINTSKGTYFNRIWYDCYAIKCIPQVDTTLATSTSEMFDRVPLCRPNATERALIEQTPGINWVTDVPDGEDCCTWTPPRSLDIKVTSPTEPGVTDVTGGTIIVTDNGDGTWQLISYDIITHFKLDKVIWPIMSDITQVEIITEELTFLEDTFGSLSSMTTFIAPASAFGLVTDFSYAWDSCSSLTSFPTINTSSGTNFDSAWYNCMALASFPMIDTSSGTNFNSTWQECESLTSFPLIDTSSGETFYGTWESCLSLTSFPSIDTSNGTYLGNTWIYCESLTSFPSIDTSNVTSFSNTWNGCSSLLSLPAMDTSKGTAFEYLFYGCTSLKCIPQIDTTASPNEWATAEMFVDCPNLCRPNASERALIEQTPGINWVSDVPDGEDCCTWTPPRTAQLGDKEITGCYLGDNKVDNAFLGDTVACHIVPPGPPPPLVIKWSRVGPDDPISVEISGADMEYSNDNGATWSIISAGSRQDLATVPGGGITGYILRETVSLGPVTRCAFCEEGLPQAMRSDITVTGGYNLTDTSWMFGGFQTYWDNVYDPCYTIDVSGLDTTNTTTMFNMFKSNEMIIIGAENFKTSNVITMEGLFKGGNDAPRELDLSRWDTSNVTNMKYMFGNSPGLAILNVDGWDTTNVTSFYGWNPQGSGPSSLTEIELSSFDTSSAVDMSGFLAYQDSLTTVGVSNLGQLDLSSCTIADVMMSGHRKLLKLDVSEWDVSRIEDLSSMISDFESAEVLDVSKWNITNCKRFAFGGCTKVKVFDISNWNSNYSLNLNDSFENCHSLEHIDISTLSVTALSQCFKGCTSLKTVKLSDTFGCTYFNAIFEDCSALTCINNINTTNNAASRADMFLNCGSLVNPDATAQADIADANGANWTGPACP